MTEFFKKYWHTMLLGVLLAASITVIATSGIFVKKQVDYFVYEETIRLEYESTLCQLTKEVDTYIHDVAPASCLNGVALTEKCLEHNFDIIFALAQGHNESHFGTCGMARKTNSVWNVHACDGKSFDEISSKGKYRSPDDAIEPYLNYLETNYLVNGKTEYDLMRKFVNKSGKRYASSETYEGALTDKYRTIKNTTKIDSLTQELKRYSIILGY